MQAGTVEIGPVGLKAFFVVEARVLEMMGGRGIFTFFVLTLKPLELAKSLNDTTESS